MRAINPRIPRDLETIVQTAIEKEPRSRYQNAGAMADDLRRFLRDEPIRARRVSPLERVVRWSRRNRRLAVAMCGIVVLLAMMFVRETILRRHAETAKQLAGQRGDELKLNLYFAEMNLAGQAASGQFGAPTVHARLEKWKPKPGTRDLRGWEWYYLYAMTHRERLVSPTLDGWTWSVDFNPAGAEYVNCVNGLGIQVRDAQTGQIIRDKTLGSARYVQWSPDGSRIAVSGYRGNVNVCDSETLEVITQIGGNVNREVWCVNWSPDGMRLATCSRAEGNDENVVRIWNSTTGELIRKLKGHSSVINEVAWSPDGTRLVSMTANSVRLWDAETGREIRKIPGGAISVCWNPDGESLVIAGGVITVLKAETGEQMAVLGEYETQEITRVRWQPGGSLLACGHGNGTVTLWETKSGGRLRSFVGHTNSVQDIDWNPQGTHIVSCGMDRTVRIWEIGLDQTQRLPIIADRIQWSQDGSLLSVAGIWSYVACVCEPDTGRIEEVDGQARQVDSAVISPDQQKVAYTGREFVKVWNRQTKETTILDESEWFKSAAWSPDNRRLIACTLRSQMAVWDVETGLKSLIDADEQPVFVDWCRNTSRLATAGSNGTVTVRDSLGSLLWQKESGQSVAEVRWSPDGSQLASAENGSIVIWEAATGNQIKTLDEIREENRSIDWSPDGTRLVSGSTNSVAIWDTASGRVAIKLPIGGVKCVRWNPDGKRIAAGAEFNGVFVWDATLGYQQADLQEPSDPH